MRKRVSLVSWLTYFLQLGTTGFGGPIALVGYFHRDLVEDREWVFNADFEEGLTLAQMTPGPVAAQLAMYLGWVHSGWVGATLTAVAFTLPAFFIVLFLAELYRRFGLVPGVQSVFHGVGAVVVGIILKTTSSLTKKTLKADPLLISVALVGAVGTLIWTQNVVWVLFLCGLFMVLLVAARKNRKSGLVFSVMVPPVILSSLFIYFLKVGAFVFGNGLVIVPLLQKGVVEQFHWVTHQQFVDSLAIGLITPGPVVIAAAFLGYLIHGSVGSLVAMIGMFLPCYLVTVLLAPIYRRIAKSVSVRGFVQGVSAAAVGAIAASVWLLGSKTVTDVSSVSILAGTLVSFYVLPKLPDSVLILVGGVVGVGFKKLGIG